MNDTLRKLLDVALARMGEPSTWQGIGFVIALTGSKRFVDFDWGQAAAFGGFVSAMIKVALPDPKIVDPNAPVAARRDPYASKLIVWGSVAVAALTVTASTWYVLRGVAQ